MKFVENCELHQECMTLGYSLIQLKCFVMEKNTTDIKGCIDTYTL